MWRRDQEAVPILLTFGETVYVKDPRISIDKNSNLSSPGGPPPSTCDEWTLTILHSKQSDSGLYECHISTEPPQILKTMLSVEGEMRQECLYRGVF